MVYRTSDIDVYYLIRGMLLVPEFLLDCRSSPRVVASVPLKVLESRYVEHATSSPPRFLAFTAGILISVS